MCVCVWVRVCVCVHVRAPAQCGAIHKLRHAEDGGGGGGGGGYQQCDDIYIKAYGIICDEGGGREGCQIPPFLRDVICGRTQ